MLISCRFSIVGLHLLLLTHIAHTFVLLTANMEDVKKLARKFVSESLAEKIADFIAKATQNMAMNASEENEEKNAAADEQEGSHQVSEENNMYNVERHGYESAVQETMRSREDVVLEKEKEEIPQYVSTEQKTPTQYVSIEQKVPEFELPDGIELKPEKVEQPKPLEGRSRYIKQAAPNTAKQYAYPVQTEKPALSKISEEDEKYNKEKEVIKYLEDNLVSSPATVKEKLKKNKIKGRPYRLLSNALSIEDNIVTDGLPDTNSTLDEFSENEFFNQKRAMDNSDIELTTRKAATEFDQYDNKNYPRAVITSGPISLVIPRKKAKDNNNNWWEKEMPSRNRDQEPEDVETRRKSWF